MTAGDSRPLAKTSNKQHHTGGNLPLVIVNPRSAGGATGENWAAIASDLRTHFGPFKVEFTKGPGDGAAIAKQSAEAGVPFIIACGGDGTIHEVANGILESGKDVELGILPSGTGGDFRRSLEIPDDPREAAMLLKKGKTRPIDVGRITFQNFDDETETRFFLNITSFGLAASIIERVKASSSLDWVPIDGVRGMASYALSMIQEVAELETTQVRIKVDDLKERTLTTVNFCVANARYFGGGMMIAPKARLADGFFDVINIGDIKTAKVILNAPTLYFGKHLSLPEVKTKLARRVEARPLDPSHEIHIEVDGELPGKLPAVYEVIPNALKLRVP